MADFVIYIFIVILIIIFIRKLIEDLESIKKKKNLEEYKRLKYEKEERKQKEGQRRKAIKYRETLKHERKNIRSHTKPEKTKSTHTKPHKEKTSKVLVPTEADIKGAKGEQLIVKALERLPEYGRVLLNIYIPKHDKNNTTTEIDVIYINANGIYVIESKNYSGVIVGSDKYDKWEQRFKGKNKFRFYNPVRQNQSHIKHLQDFLWTVDKDLFYSLVIFGDQCKLQVYSEADVINLKELNKFMGKQVDNKMKIFNEKEINKIYNLLLPYTQVSDEVKQAHIENVKKAKEKFEGKRKIGF